MTFWQKQLAAKANAPEPHRSSGLTSRSGRALQWFHWSARPDLAAGAGEFDLRGAPGGARKLNGKTVVALGLGAVGGEVLAGLARLGVGRLIGVDPDRYEKESWMTQPAAPSDAGRLKARVQGSRARAAHPGVDILTAAGFAQDLPLHLLRGADLLVAAGDNLELLVWAGNMGAALGIPLLQGAVHGETWTAFLRRYDPADRESACPACAFSVRDWAGLQAREGCDPGLMRAQGRESTRTLPNVCRTAADLVVSEGLKQLLGLSDRRAAAEEIAFCLLSNKPMRTRLDRNPDCRCPHARWNIIDVDRDRSQVSLGMLAREIETDRRPSVRGELPWISFTICGRCGKRQPVRRFGTTGADLGRCRCGEPLQASPVGVRSVLSSADFRQVADLPLTELGLPQGAAVGFVTGETWTYFFVGPPPGVPESSISEAS